MNPLRSRLAAEFAGTAALLAIVVGSGHMGETLSAGNAALALLANSTATGLGLWLLIELLGPISGAHFNPAVTWTFAMRGELAGRDAVFYTMVQITGAVAGVALAHAMFDLPLLQIGVKLRSGPGQWLSESVASAGLLATIMLGTRTRPAAVPALVAAWIACAYWFTASTSFANPAVTIARALTTTFAGIRPADVGPFIVAQFAGAGIAAYALRRPRSASTLSPSPIAQRER